MYINVKYNPVAYEASKFWFKDHKVNGIAEWEEVEIECEHDYAEYDIDSTRDGLIFNDIECPDCTLSDDDKRMLIKNFEFDRYYDKGDVSDYEREV